MGKPSEGKRIRETVWYFWADPAKGGSMMNERLSELFGTESPIPGRACCHKDRTLTRDLWRVDEYRFLARGEAIARAFRAKYQTYVKQGGGKIIPFRNPQNQRKAKKLKEKAGLKNST